MDYDYLADRITRNDLNLFFHFDNYYSVLVQSFLSSCHEVCDYIASAHQLKKQNYYRAQDKSPLDTSFNLSVLCQRTCSIANCGFAPRTLILNLTVFRGNGFFLCFNHATREHTIFSRAKELSFTINNKSLNFFIRLKIKISTDTHVHVRKFMQDLEDRPIMV